MSDSEKTTARNMHEELESVLLEFDRRWHADEMPNIAEYVERLAPPVREKGLVELIKIDLEYQWRRGAHKVLEDYVAECDQFEDVASVPIDLIREEIACRKRFDRGPSASEIANRFPRHASRLQSLFDSSLPSDSQRPSTAARSLETMLGEQRRGRNEGEPDFKEVLAGRFEIREQIGRGAFATVFRAWDVRLRRPVAVKMTRAQHLANASMGRRFLREAQSAAQLQHPGIVSVYEVGQDRERYFIVQEFIRGGTLGDRLDGEPVGEEQAARWLVSICEAVDYAHRCGIVHRDLKPANIMMDRHGTPRIADFGLAARADAAVNLTHDGELLGTPAYMAPEQARGDQANVGAHSDIYSLGVLMYQLLCGRLPFKGNTTAVIHSVIHGEPPPLRKLRPGLNVDIQTICLKAMAKEPGRRYPSARAMADDLVRYLNKEPIRARKIGLWEQATLWCRRQPALAATVFASAVLITLLSAISINRIRAERNRFRHERDRANVALVKSLTQNAESEIASRRTGWWDNAMNAIREASRIEVADSERRRLRELAIELLSDTNQRLQLADTWRISDQGVTSLRMDESQQLVAVGLLDGSGAIVDAENGRILAVCASPGKRSLEDVGLNLSMGIMIGRTGYQAWTWDLTEFVSSHRDIRDGGKPLNLEARALGQDEISALAMSPKGARLAIGMETGVVQLFGVEHGAIGDLTATLPGNGEEPLALDFSPDGTLLASANKQIQVWDLATGQQSHSYTHSDPIHTVRFAPNQHRIQFADIASFSRRVWDFADKHELIPSVKSPVREVAWLADGRPVSCEQHGALVVWSGSKLATEASGFGETFSVAVGANDEYLLGGYRDGKIRKWQLQRSEVARNFQSHHSHSIRGDGLIIFDRGTFDLTKKETPHRFFDAVEPRSMVVAPDGRLFLGTVSGRLLRWEAALTEPIAAEFVNDQGIAFLALDTKRSAVITADHDGNVIRWDNESMQPVQRASVTLDRVTSCSVWADRDELIVGGRRGWARLRLDDLSEIERHSHFMVSCATACQRDRLAISRPDHSIQIRSPGGTVTSLTGSDSRAIQISFTADAERLLAMAADNSIRAWDCEDGHEIWRFDLPHQGRAFAVDAQQRYVLLSHVQGAICLSATDGKPVSELANANGTTAFAWEPAGDAFWLGRDGAYRFDIEQLVDNDTIDLVDQTPTIVGGHRNVAWGVAHSPDGRGFITAGHYGDIKLWNPETYRCERTFQHRQRTLLWDADFSTDATVLATCGGSERGGEIAIWDTASWQLQHELILGKRMIAGVDFHPTQPWLAAGSTGGKLAIYNYHTGELLAQPSGRFPCMDVEFSRDGTALAAALVGDGVAIVGIDPTADSPDAILTPAAPRRIVEGKERIFAVAFDSASEHIAAAMESGKVRLYRLDTLESVVTLATPYARFRQVGISPNDKYVTVSSYGSGSIAWNLNALREELDQLGLNW